MGSAFSGTGYDSFFQGHGRLLTKKPAAIGKTGFGTSRQNGCEPAGRPFDELRDTKTLAISGNPFCFFRHESDQK
jgi:hypothetical protein